MVWGITTAPRDGGGSAVMRADLASGGSQVAVATSTT